MIISFLLGFWGYLMIANINLGVLELAKHGNKSALTKYLVVILTFEFIYCFGSLYFMQYLMIYPKVIIIAQYIAIAFLLILGFWALFEKPKDIETARKDIIRRGYWSAIIHPQQVPFWLFWGIILIENQIINGDIGSLLFFAAFNVLGAFCMLMIYVVYGNKLISLIKLNLHIIKKIVGIICLVTALYMTWELFKS